MLAYTTVSDLFYMPTALEATVYFGGFLFVLALPYLFLGIIDRLSAAKTEADNNAPELQSVND